MGLSSTPRILEMRVVPVAGRDSMPLNLSGAHAPFFPRNVVLLRDDAGHTGLGEVPGGERIRETLDESRALVVGKSIGAWHEVLNAIRRQFGDRDHAGRGLQTRRRAVAIPAGTPIGSGPPQRARLCRV